MEIRAPLWPGLIDPGLDANAVQAASAAGAPESAADIKRLERVNKAMLVVRSRTDDLAQAFLAPADTAPHEPLPPHMLLARHQSAQRTLSEVARLPHSQAPQVDGFNNNDSHRDLFEKIFGRIQGIQDGWVNQNQEALSKYLEFFQKFSALMAKLKDAVSAGSDGKIRVDFRALVPEVRAFLNSYGSDAMGRFPSRAAAERFLIDAGLTVADFPITQLPDGSFGMGMPEAPVQAILDSMIGGTGQPWNADWDNARYQAWLAGKDSHTEQLQHNSQVLGERFSRVTQLYDNLVKVLSATIESITDVDKAFVSF